MKTEPKKDNQTLLLNRYLFKEKLGEGTYGQVNKYLDKETGEFVAIKKIKTFLENEGVPTLALREILSLKQLKHPNIIQLKDVHFQKDKNLFYLGNINQYLSIWRLTYLDSSEKIGISYHLKT
jgi:serine/threonine protein kinase